MKHFVTIRNWIISLQDMMFVSNFLVPEFVWKTFFRVKITPMDGMLR